MYQGMTSYLKREILVGLHKTDTLVMIWCIHARFLFDVSVERSAACTLWFLSCRTQSGACRSSEDTDLLLVGGAKASSCRWTAKQPCTCRSAPKRGFASSPKQAPWGIGCWSPKATEPSRGSCSGGVATEYTTTASCCVGAEGGSVGSKGIIGRIGSAKACTYRRP